MPSVISYTRFSSPTQSKGSSTERQLELIGNWLERHPEYTLSPLSANDRGRSGYKGEHLKHGLGSIIEAIEARKIKPQDVLLIEALDRLGRLEPFEMFELISRIINAGVSIITLEDDKEYSRETTKSDISSLYILLGKIQQAHEYSDRLSTRVKAAYKNKLDRARKGQGIRVSTPVWLNTDGTLKPNEASAVLNCIELYLKGYGTRSILIRLSQKFPFLSSVHPSTLKRWFKNRAIIGEWQGVKAFTPLIEIDVFYNLQRELNSRKKNMSPEQVYDLSGLIVCASCRSKYYFRRKENKDNVIVYANCSTYLKRGGVHCVNNKSMPYEVLDFVFKQTFAGHLWRAAASKTIDKTVEEVESIKSERMSVVSSINNLLEVLVKVPGQQELIEKLQALEVQKEKLNKKLLVLESGRIDSPDAYSLLSFLNSLDSSPSQSMLVFEKREELQKDPVMLREALKGVDYKLLVQGARIEASDGSVFELIRRSQQYKCYIITCTYKNEGEESNETTWAAVGRNMHAIEARSEMELIRKLHENNHDSENAKL